MKRRLFKVALWLRRACFAAVVSCVLFVLALAAAWMLFPFPEQRLEQWPVSPRVLDRHGQPMLQLVGSDDQWRMKVGLAEISPWLIEATIAVEDERFRSHIGVDPIAVMRAAGQNLGSGRVVSGASTLSMQVCRMMSDQPRTWRAKIVESFRALQLEQRMSKNEILETYLNIAPYGGNIRGVEAASLAYFGKRAKDLSLAEAALIAGLPQSPSRLRPDRHLERAKARQSVVLRRMVEREVIDQAQAAEAMTQVLVLANGVRATPQAAEHGAWFAMQRRPLGGVTTIDLSLQREVLRLTREQMQSLPVSTDAAVVIIDIATGDLLAMLGSAGLEESITPHVNGATARRSPGSTLKPFIYAAGFETHRINESSLLHDGPIERAGWSPSNFDRTFSGDVTVTAALRRSLNVPAILAAEGIGLTRCIGVIESAGIELPRDAATRGGLAVVTGAVEVSLVDVTNAYATLGRGGVRQPVRIFSDEPATTTRVLSVESCAKIDDILSTAHRRPRGMELIDRDNLPFFMWKTGTSSGRRDAWAVGHNHKVAIGVWVGRPEGSGAVQFVGGDAAEPLLAKLFDVPALRSLAFPSTPESWLVTNPLPPPKEKSDSLRILSPSTGSRFLAVGGSAIVHPRSNRTSPLHWFINGKRIESDEASRLTLAPGSYEIRCIDDAGDWAKSNFEVR